MPMGPISEPGGSVRKLANNFKVNCGWRSCEKGNDDPTQRLLGKNCSKGDGGVVVRSS